MLFSVQKNCDVSINGRKQSKRLQNVFTTVDGWFKFQQTAIKK